MHVLVTCKYKRIGSKTTEKRWRHHFPHYKSMRAFCCHGPGPKSNPSELLCLSWLQATLMMIQMNELAWRQHFPIISLWEIFRRSRVANSVVSSPIWPTFELVRDFMHVLVTCKYKKDQIKNNWEKVETSFSHYKSMGVFCCQETRLLIQSAPKPYAAFPLPQ